MLPPWARSSAAAAVIDPVLVAEVSAPPVRTANSPPSRAVSARVTSCPATRPTVPAAAVRVPSFSTTAPIRAILPPSAPILPRLTTDAFEAPEKVRAPPVMNAVSDALRAEATKLPPVLMTPVLPITTPLGLMR